MEKTKSLLDNGTYTITFLSSTEYLDKVEAVTVKISKELQFDNSSVDDLSIAITEMFNNAVQHGIKTIQIKKLSLPIHVRVLTLLSPSGIRVPDLHWKKSKILSLPKIYCPKMAGVFT